MGGNNGGAWNNNQGAMNGGGFNNNYNNEEGNMQWSNNPWSSNNLSAVPVGDFGYNEYSEQWPSDNGNSHQSPYEEDMSPSRFSPSSFGNSQRLV